MSVVTEIKETIDGIVDGNKLFQEKHNKELEAVKTQNAELQSRIEELESRRGLPTKAGDGKPVVDFKVFPTSAGDIYEIPAHVKMADVLPPEKQPEISFERWLAAAVLGERCSDKKAVEFVRDKKQLVTTSTGLQIPNEYISQWIDKLRANMVLSQCGMSVTTMLDKTQTRSAITADPTATWHSEAGSISAANPTFAERKLTAQTLVTRCTASVELSQDSPDFGQQLAAVMARSMAAELDRAGLNGSGTPPEPLGLISTTGIGSVTGTTIADYSKFIDAVRVLLTAGVDLATATRNVIINPYVWGKLENLATGISSDKTQLPVPRCFQNTNWRVTTQLPNNSPVGDTAVLGDFSYFLMGIRREASVEVLKLDTYASKLILEFVGYLRGDFVCTRPLSFCKIVSLA